MDAVCRARRLLWQMSHDGYYFPKEVESSNDAAKQGTQALGRYRELMAAATAREDDHRPFDATFSDGRRLRVNAQRPADIPTDQAESDGGVRFESNDGTPTPNASLEVISPSRYGDGMDSIRPDFVLGAERNIALHELVHFDDPELADDRDYVERYDDLRNKDENDEYSRTLYTRLPREVRANEGALIAEILDDYERSDRRQSPAEFAENWVVDRDGTEGVQSYFDGTRDRVVASRRLAALAAIAISRKHRVSTGRFTRRVPDEATTKRARRYLVKSENDDSTSSDAIPRRLAWLRGAVAQRNPNRVTPIELMGEIHPVE